MVFSQKKGGVLKVFGTKRVRRFGNLHIISVSSETLGLVHTYLGIFVKTFFVFCFFHWFEKKKSVHMHAVKRTQDQDVAISVKTRWPIRSL